MEVVPFTLCLLPFTFYHIPNTIYQIPKINVEIETTLKNKLDPFRHLSKGAFAEKPIE